MMWRMDGGDGGKFLLQVVVSTSSTCYFCLTYNGTSTVLHSFFFLKKKIKTKGCGKAIAIIFFCSMLFKLCVPSCMRDEIRNDTVLVLYRIYPALLIF